MFTMVQVATLFEATPLIRGLGLHRTPISGAPRCYQSDDSKCLLWISGIGPAACRRSVQRLTRALEPLRGPRHWINIGIAGSNQPNIAKGTLFQVTTLHSAEDPQSAPPIRLRHCGVPHASSLPTAALTTVHTPKLLPPDSDAPEPPMLYDMEAYAFAYTLQDTLAVAPTALDCFKVVSDHADGALLDFRSLAPAYDAAIASLLPHFHGEPGK